VSLHRHLRQYNGVPFQETHIRKFAVLASAIGFFGLGVGYSEESSAYQSRIVATTVGTKTYAVVQSAPPPFAQRAR
jgi:hypothetical protein